jgi:hypothetical protein
MLFIPITLNFGPFMFKIGEQSLFIEQKIWEYEKCSLILPYSK